MQLVISLLIQASHSEPLLTTSSSSSYLSFLQVLPHLKRLVFLWQKHIRKGREKEKALTQFSRPSSFSSLVFHEMRRCVMKGTIAAFSFFLPQVNRFIITAFPPHNPSDLLSSHSLVRCSLIFSSSFSSSRRVKQWMEDFRSLECDMEGRE